jgi:hypothetical protein
MQARARVLIIVLAILPQTLAAQATAGATPAAQSTSPVADALRSMEQRYARILVAAAEAMPADKYNYRPTPAQMSFAMIQVHLANEGNDLLCSKVGGVAAPQRTPVDTTMSRTSSSRGCGRRSSSVRRRSRRWTIRSSASRSSCSVRTRFRARWRS